jgi:hypothetical protein
MVAKERLFRFPFLFFLSARALLKSGKPVQIQYGAKDQVIVSWQQSRHEINFQIADFKDAQAFRDLLKLNGNVHQFFDYGLQVIFFPSIYICILCIFAWHNFDQGHAFLSSEAYRKQLVVVYSFYCVLLSMN